MENIENVLQKISESLNQLAKIQKERLKLEKETIRENKKGMKEALKLSDIMLGKGEKFQQDILKSLGIPEKIDIDGIELGDDLNK